MCLKLLRRDVCTSSFVCLYSSSLFVCLYSSSSFVCLYSASSFVCLYSASSFVCLYSSSSFVCLYSSSSFVCLYSSSCVNLKVSKQLSWKKRTGFHTLTTGYAFSFLKKIFFVLVVLKYSWS